MDRSPTDPTTQAVLQPLCAACTRGELVIAKRLHRSLPSAITAADACGNTPLQFAVAHGHLDLARWLVSKGANVTASNFYGWQCIHEACYHGHSELASWLLQAGADLTALTLMGAQPLHLACFAGHVDMAQWCCAEGAQPHARDNDDGSALHYACRGGQQHVAQWLQSAHGLTMPSASRLAEALLAEAAAEGAPVCLGGSARALARSTPSAG